MFLHQQSPRCSSPAMIDLRIKALTDGWMANIIICAAFSSPAEDELQLLPSISFFQVIFILQFPLTPKRVKDRSISFQFQPGRGRGCLLPPQHVPVRVPPRGERERGWLGIDPSLGSAAARALTSCSPATDKGTGLRVSARQKRSFSPQKGKGSPSQDGSLRAQPLPFCSSTERSWE